MSYSEQAVTFSCARDTLIGILSAPQGATVATDSATGNSLSNFATSSIVSDGNSTAQSAKCTTGVVIIIGGPQYRAGSHRQFVLLARAVAMAGYPVLRFDYRGMGDSTGEQRDFLQVTTDIAAAIDTLQRKVSSVRHVVLWGLCDAASAALLYCGDTQDPRVRGLCLLNPWVRSEVGLARAHVKHYYADRLKQRDFWVKLLSGKVARSALTGLMRNLATAFSTRTKVVSSGSMPFQERMAVALHRFDGPALLFLSENDYTAKEFGDCLETSPTWANAITNPRLVRHKELGADHTLSQRKSSLVAEKCTIDLVAQVSTFAV